VVPAFYDPRPLSAEASSTDLAELGMVLPRTLVLSQYSTFSFIRTECRRHQDQD
jgi:hypothetical protein